MPSIRKTKKRLEREIDKLYLDKFARPLLDTRDLWEAIYIYNSIGHKIQRKEKELQQLKSKKR